MPKYHPPRDQKPVFKLGTYVAKGIEGRKDLVKAFEQKPPPWLTLTPTDADVYTALEVPEAIVKDITSAIYELLLKVKKRFDEEEDAVLLIEANNCGRKCGVCLGHYSLHFPHLRIKPPSGKRIKIRSRDLRVFLEQYLDRDEVSHLFYLIDVRHELITWINYFALRMQNLGLIDELVKWSDKLK